MKLSNFFLAAFLPGAALAGVIFERESKTAGVKTTQATNACQQALLNFKGTFPSDFSYLSPKKIRDVRTTALLGKREDIKAQMYKDPVSGTSSDSLYTIGMSTCLAVGVTIPNVPAGKIDKLLAHIYRGLDKEEDLEVGKLLKEQTQVMWNAVQAAWKTAKAAAPANTIQPTYYVSLSHVASTVDDIVNSPSQAAKSSEEKATLRVDLTRTQMEFETFVTNFAKWMNKQTGGAEATHVKTKTRIPGMGSDPGGTMRILQNGQVLSEGVAWH